MANITKAERERREAEKEAKIREEIEAKIRAEYEEKAKKELVKETPKNTLQPSARIPLDTIVPVVCNTVGGAVYISKRNMGYRVEWDDMGSVEYMEIGELASMRNTDRRFFEDNWIILEDTDEYTASQMYDFLKVAKYYSNIFSPSDVDKLFESSKDEIIRVCSGMSSGIKQTVAAKAKLKLDDGTLDKNIVEPLETALGIQFTI